MFRTEIKPKPFPVQSNYTHSHVLIGSCFSENIGGKLKRLKFDTTINPFGIMYNPLSIVCCLNRVLEQRAFGEDDVFEYLEKWHSFEFHSNYSKRSKEETLEVMNVALQEAYQKLKQADWLTLTFGTAWYYYHTEAQMPVANCHKLPAKQFSKQLINPSFVEVKLVEVLEELKKLNPKLKIVLTVSPVRHLKDGFVENQRSKGILLDLVARVVERLDYGFYFPAYEIMMDDLRDYRFYAPDMLHPNELAIDYIWDKFKDAAIMPKTKGQLKEVENLIKSASHRPFDVTSIAHQNFVKKQLIVVDQLESSFNIDLSEEKEMFTNQLSQ